jgi:YidC/Oxa1 family membrane protein insertase
MDKRFSFALSVSLLFMFGYLWFSAPKQPDSAGALNPAAVEQPQSQSYSQPETSPTATEVADAETIYQEATRADLNDNIVVDTDRFRARLSNRGAALLELYSREYYRDVSVTEDESLHGDPAHWLEMGLNMDPEVPSLLLRRNAEDGAPLDRSNWDYEVQRVAAGTDVVFRFDDGNGLHYRKTLKFRDGRPDIGVEIFFGNRDTSPSGRLSYLLTSAGNMPDRGGARFQRLPSGVAVYGSDSLESRDGSQLTDDVFTLQVDPPGSLQYYGTHSNHFAAVLRPLDEDSRRAVSRVVMEPVLDRVTLQRRLDEIQTLRGTPATAVETAELREENWNNARSTGVLEVPRVQGGHTLNFQYFVGPKSPVLMKQADFQGFHQLYEEDYGSMAWINKSLLWILRMFHSLTGNWGVAIILLTVVVKMMLFPMTRMQSRQMEQFSKKMAKLKPQLEEIKKKYKNNLRKYQEEQQKMMKEHGVRAPLFGCLVLVLQFPVFIGLFQILRTSFELRHSPFFGWINDLSQPDAMPLPVALFGFTSVNLLPLLMVIAMVLHTKLMPKPKDPQQAQMQKMMLFMPFLFCFFLYSYAAGLSLYMLTNALLGIVQTKFLKISVPS